jgi:CubicO group peptidase (beta-lactamase class C family)
MTTAKADLSNWLTFPHNRWAFTNIDKILKTATISKPDTSLPLPKTPTDFEAFSLEHNGTNLDLTSYISRTQTDGLIILQHGKILYEEYLNENSKDSKHIIMSLTKSITGLLVGILQAQGKLSVTDLVSKYVPEISGTVYKDKTIQECIDMRAGVVYVDGQTEYRAAAGWLPSEKSKKTLREFLGEFTPQEVIDGRFEYVSTNTDLVGWVLERASGKTFAELVGEFLWVPMGAESDALVTVDSEGFARAAGGLVVTLRDLGRVAGLIVNDGRNAEGETVVPAAYIRDILRGGSKEAWQRGNFAKDFDGYFDDMAYRAHCYVGEESETIMGFGVFGQVFIAERKTGVVLVSTRSQETPLDFDKIKMTLGAFKEIRRLLAQE